jgi:gluconokinase
MASPSDVSNQSGEGYRWVIMGVCGCGKSTVGCRPRRGMFKRRLHRGRRVSTRRANVVKMSAGIP